MRENKPERTQFDKFMDRIIEQERASELKEPQHEDPRRVRNRLYQERWQNRIRWVRARDSDNH